MRFGWNRSYLGDVIDVVSGLVDPNAHPYASWPHVGGDNIESHTGKLGSLRKSKDLGLISGKYAFGPEHVLYSKIRPNLNKVVVPDFKGVCSADIYPLKPKNELVTREFLAYLLRSSDFLGYAFKHSTRTNIPKLNRKTLLKYPFRLPPLDEQKRIAAILDAADALRVKRRESITQLDTLLQSTFLDMFGDPVTNAKGWNESTLADFSTKVTDGDHHTPRRTEAGIKLLSARNILDGEIDLTNTDFVDVSEYQRMIKRCYPERGDVLISCSGSIGRVSRIRFDEPIVLVRSAALVKIDHDKAVSEFVEHLLRTPALKAAMLRSAKSSSQANLFQKAIKNLPVFAPPLDLQRRFATIVESIEQQKARQRAHFAELDTLFASLQSRTFRGDL